MAIFTSDFPSGFFFIRCKEKEVAADVSDGNMLNDAQIIIWPQKYVDSINQLWMHEAGFLINKKSGLGDLKKEKSVIQYVRKAGLAQNQRWKYQDGYVFPAAAPHLCLDIRGGDYKDGTSVFINTKKVGTPTQQWLIEPFEDERSLQDLELLRPSQSRHSKPGQLYDSYRKIYRERISNPSQVELIEAMAFQAIRLLLQSADKQPLAEQKEILQKLVTQEVVSLQGANTTTDMTRAVEQTARAYFVREYESQVQ
ncbi:ricin B lectin domain-containing protein [Spinellus fusiger]|nr:ricin B lectin domain-containing protein [Spinellus fusiger]